MKYEKKNMHVCINLDVYFIFQAVIMIDSLVQKLSNDVKLNIHILYDGNNTEKYKTFKKYLSLKNINYTFYKVNPLLFTNAFISHHITITTYYRLVIAKLLPNNIEKVLYLDCDILILKDIYEIYDIDLNGYELGCVEENLGIENKKRLGMDIDDFYFNAGVMLINLKNWRINGITEKLLNCLNLNNIRLKYWDQDILNLIVKNKLKMKNIWNATQTSDSGNLNINEICILHFTGPCKPWNCEGSKYKKLYFNSLYSNYNTLKARIFYNFLQNLNNVNLVSFNLQYIKQKVRLFRLIFKPNHVDLFFWYLKNKI